MVCHNMGDMNLFDRRSALSARRNTVKAGRPAVSRRKSYYSIAWEGAFVYIFLSEVSECSKNVPDRWTAVHNLPKNSFFLIFHSASIEKQTENCYTITIY